MQPKELAAKAPGFIESRWVGTTYFRDALRQRLGGSRTDMACYCRMLPKIDQDIIALQYVIASMEPHDILERFSNKECSELRYYAQKAKGLLNALVI